MKSFEHLSLKIAIILDGSPGHEKQTRGIVKALERLYPLRVTEIRISRPSFWGDVLNWMKYFLGLQIKSDQKPGYYDLLIGTGTHTHFPLLSLKKRLNTLAVVCMAPSRFLRKRFDLCFIPQHDGIPAGENVFLTIGPPNCSEAGAGHESDRALILLGGVDTKSHIWNSEEIRLHIERLIEFGSDKRWTISSSPRTPRETVALVEDVAERFENVDFYKFSDTLPGWIEEQYSLNKTVWVTADSMSMVYEALSAGCFVGLLPVAWKRKNSKFKRSEDYLLKHQMVVSYKSWNEGTAQWDTRKPLDESGRCAEEIMKRWFPKN